MRGASADDETNDRELESKLTALGRPSTEDLEAARIRRSVVARLFETSAPPVTVGRFTLLERLGSGTSGVVYAAYDPELDRKVALKVLKPDPRVADDDASRLRLQREAQAMARLSHPNVVTIYDAQVVEAQVVIAMEFVDGRTLRAWLQETPRSAAEIGTVFIQAARGLAAAHTAGLVHRDFKPENVLVGRDGRVRVTDFGLAKPMHPGPVAPNPAPPASKKGTEASLTGTGNLVGTPAYMAPEQWEGSQAEPASDQFAFCVALYEALTGEHPYRGDAEDLDHLRERLGSEWRSQVEGVGASSAAMRTVLRRGLQAQPADRYPSMEALIQNLEPPPRKRWGLLAVAAAATLTAGLAAQFWTQASTARCDVDPNEFSGVWDAQVRQNVSAAFSATGWDHATTMFERVSEVLDRYTDRWGRAFAEACTDTHQRQIYSAEVLQRRVQCLREGREAMGALTQILTANPSRATLSRATDAALRLPPTSRCAKVPALRQPTTEAAPDAQRAALQNARALAATGQHREAMQAYRALSDDPRSVATIQMRAHYERALLEQERRQGKQAAKSLQAAAALASSLEDLEFVALAQMQQARVDGRDHGNFPAAEARMDVVKNLLPVLPDPRLGRLELARSRGIIELVQGHYGNAEAHLTHAWEQAQAYYGPDHPETRRLLLNLGNVFRETGEYPKAREFYHKVITTIAAHQGPNTPDYAGTFTNIGVSYKREGRYQEALEHYTVALEVFERAVGPEARGVSMVLNNMGNVYVWLEEYRKAEDAFVRARAIEAKRLGAEHPLVRRRMHNLGWTYFHQGDYVKAEQALRIALTADIEIFGAGAPNTAQSTRNLGRALARQGRTEEALGYLEEAVKIYHSSDGDPVERARGEFALAQVLVDQPSSRARALRLGQSALSTLQDASHPFAKKWTSEVQRWLQAQ